MSITRINTFQAKPGKEDAVREFLSAVISFIVDAPGCHSVELLVGADDSSELAIIEVWDNSAAHQASAARIPLALSKQAPDLFASPAVGSYYRSVARAA